MLYILPLNSPLLYLRPEFVMYFMALLQRGINCSSRQKGFESVIQWHHHCIRHIKDNPVLFQNGWENNRYWEKKKKRAATLTLKERGVQVRRAGMKIESLGNMLMGRGVKQKHFGVAHLSQEFNAQKYSPKLIFLYENYSIYQVCRTFSFIKKVSLFNSYKMTAGCWKGNFFTGHYSSLWPFYWLCLLWTTFFTINY